MKISKNMSLMQFNTFGINALASMLVNINAVSDLHNLFIDGILTNNKSLVLSEGSNVLFVNNFDGLVLVNQILGKRVINDDDKNIFLCVSSGESWSDLVEYTVTNNWGGIENMIGIPGKVGAAPIQNIGAYGAELKDVMVSLKAFDMHTGSIVKFTNSECEFGYRKSIFKTIYKNRYFITSVLLKLSKVPKVNLTYKPLSDAFSVDIRNKVSIVDVSRKVSEIRNSKIPNPGLLKNAGSFFKNPLVKNKKLKELLINNPSIPSYAISRDNNKLPAAWLIEQCGWKGKRIGNVGTYEKQPLIIINYGNATGNQIFDFAHLIQNSVFEKFGVNLEMEVNVL